MNHFCRTTSYGLMSQLTKMKLFSPHIYCVTKCGDRGLGPPRALIYIDPSQPARPEAIQSDLQGSRQAIVDYYNLKPIPSPEASPCYNTRSEGAEKSSNVLNKHDRVFWILYLLEKHLSLRLGYSSTIQDRDITVPLPGASQLPATAPMQYWQNLIKLANIAGRIYENLYSPSSLSLGTEERHSRAMTWRKRCSRIL